MIGNSITNKIVIDARMFHHSGIGKYLQMLLPFLVEEFSVTLLGDPDVLTTYHTSSEIIPFKNPIYSITEQLKLPQIIPRADLFWSPHYNVPILPIRASRRIVTIHDVYHLAFKTELSLTQKAYVSIVMKMAVKLSDQIITVSEFSKRELLKYTDAKSESINVIYNGVNKPVKDNKAIKAKYSLPENYLLFVGNVKPHKNLRDLLAAYILQDSEFKLKYKIVIVGKKEGFITGDNSITAFINSNPILQESVTFTDFIEQDDMDAIYSEASLFVFPSKYEGFGLPPLEAMANGCPVIASNAASMPEICGDAAVYYSPGDVSQLKDQIKNVLKDRALQEKLIAKGLNRSLGMTWEKSARAHADLFIKLLK